MKKVAIDFCKGTLSRIELKLAKDKGLRDVLESNPSKVVGSTKAAKATDDGATKAANTTTGPPKKKARTSTDRVAGTAAASSSSMGGPVIATMSAAQCISSMLADDEF